MKKFNLNIFSKNLKLKSSLSRFNKILGLLYTKKNFNNIFFIFKKRINFNNNIFILEKFNFRNNIISKIKLFKNENIIVKIDPFLFINIYNKVNTNLVFVITKNKIYMKNPILTSFDCNYYNLIYKFLIMVRINNIKIFNIFIKYNVFLNLYKMINKLDA